MRLLQVIIILLESVNSCIIEDKAIEICCLCLVKLHLKRRAVSGDGCLQKAKQENVFNLDYREVNLYKRTEVIKMVHIPYNNFDAPFDKSFLYFGKQKM